MKLTVGMATWGDVDGVYFTVQALRAYHDLKDIEILIIDNKGSENLYDWVKAWGSGIRYEKYTDFQGTASRQQVFEQAKGEYVVCIDSHVLLLPGALTRLWDGDSLIHGPMVYDNMASCCVEMKDIWRDNMWGIWGDSVSVNDLPKDPFEIWGHGLGLFGSRKDTWLGFNKNFRQFGGEEGYIHEKYRKAGRKVLCLPWMKWVHRFESLREQKNGYQNNLLWRVHNYIEGFKELDINIQPVIDHFGIQIVKKAMENSGK
jgi:glycosyltransferase involved in cell wall biosynthesis